MRRKNSYSGPILTFLPSFNSFYSFRKKVEKQQQQTEQPGGRLHSSASTLFIRVLVLPTSEKVIFIDILTSFIHFLHVCILMEKKNEIEAGAHICCPQNEKTVHLHRFYSTTFVFGWWLFDCLLPVLCMMMIMIITMNWCVFLTINGNKACCQ